MEFSAQQSAAMLDTARRVIRLALAGEPVMVPACHDPALLQPAGCFVSLHDLQDKLRGCIGRIDAVEPLIGAVAAAAVSVLQDPRFKAEPVTLGELPNLKIELSIVSPRLPVDNVLAFEPADDGIFLAIGKRCGCFLPQVARDTGWSRQQLLARLCTEKMGLAPDAWRLANARLFVFKTVIVGPERFETPMISQPLFGTVKESQ